MDHLYLAHHGIKGMKWGVRRFQNPDGSLTSAGKARYGGPDGHATSGGIAPKKTRIPSVVTSGGIAPRKTRIPSGAKQDGTYYKVSKSADQKQDGQSENKRVLSDKAKKNLKIAAGVAAVAVVSYGAYKVGKNYCNAKKLNQLNIDLQKYKEISDAGRRGLYNADVLADKATRAERAGSSTAHITRMLADRERQNAGALVKEGFSGRAKTTSEMGRILSGESTLDTSIREFFEKQLGY